MASHSLLLACLGTLSVVASQGWLPAQAADPSAPKPAAAAPKPAVVDLAKYLKQIGAKMYGAYWCPHCHHQRALFGEATFNQYITYIECDPRGTAAKPNLCRAAKITGYPTWEIRGKFYPGTRSLEELAAISGYKGSRKF